MDYLQAALAAVERDARGYGDSAVEGEFALLLMSLINLYCHNQITLFLVQFNFCHNLRSELWGKNWRNSFECISYTSVQCYI